MELNQKQSLLRLSLNNLIDTQSQLHIVHTIFNSTNYIRMKTQYRFIAIAAAALLIGGTLAHAEDATTVQELQKQFNEFKKQQAEERAAHEKEVNSLKNQISEMKADRGIKSPPTTKETKEHKELADNGINYRSEGLLKAGGLKFGAYGEMLYRWQEHTVSAFDPRRIVLLPSYSLNDWIIFNSEIEIEHGGAGVDFTNDGNVEIEQAYIDFLFNEHFNWRSLGLDVVPIGRVNLFHEPTVFYSTDRPELYREIIPTTWTEGSTSIYGKIVDGLQYQAMLSSGLEDRSANNGINGNNGIRGARPSTGQDFNQTNGTPAFTGRLAYQPPFIPGLDGSTSWHHSEASSGGNTFALNGDIPVDIIDTELRYLLPNTGWEFRADFAIDLIGNDSNLRANNDGDSTNNVGSYMWGTYAEVAYHFWPKAWSKGRGKNMDFVPFFRYTHLDLQAGRIGGSDATTYNGGNDRDVYTFGFAYFPIPEVVLKLDYRVVDDDRISGTPNASERNQLQVAAGFFF